MSVIDGEDQDLRWYFKAPIADLETQAGALLLGEGLGAGGLDPRAALRAFREWFAERKRDLQDRVCSNPLNQDLVSNSGQDLTALATVVLPIAVEYQVALLVAAIMLRSGVVAFCADWSPTN